MRSVVWMESVIVLAAVSWTSLMALATLVMMEVGLVLMECAVEMEAYTIVKMEEDTVEKA